MTDNVANRRILLADLRRELYGPDPQGAPIQLADELQLPDPKEQRKANPEPSFVPDAYRPWRDASTGEEILTIDKPCKRYGVGVLYARKAEAQDPGDARDEEEDNTPDEPSDTPPPSAEVEADFQKILGRGSRRGGRPKIDDDSATFDGIAGANSYLPSAVGLSFLVDVKQQGILEVSFTGARYVPIRVYAGTRVRTWWLRRPVKATARLPLKDLVCDEPKVVPVKTTLVGFHARSDRESDIPARFHVLTRQELPGHALVTVTFVNDASLDVGRGDDLALFQTELTVSEGHERPVILPYPRMAAVALDEEEAEIELLYRNRETFAVGHGCAADWGLAEEGRVKSVSTAALPAHEIPSTTSDIELGENLDPTPNGQPLLVPMAALAGLRPTDDGRGHLEKIVKAYRRWIESREADALPTQHRPAAVRNIKKCREALRRMQEGLDLLAESGPHARLVRNAFQLANHAMYLQRLRSGDRRVREFEWNDEENRWQIEPYPADSGAGVEPTWRPFQIAFLLLALPSATLSNDPYREVVELIWFPTGGGKTEAYLGLAAYSMFLRRLRALQHDDPQEDAGVHVLMRYTLRLLTAQQFQRAAALICAMEHLRRSPPPDIALGKKPFTLGMWTGATPNDRASARKAYKALTEGHAPEDNIVVLERCPWCRAAMGPRQRQAAKQGTGPKKKSRKSRGRTATTDISVLGYAKRARGGSPAETVVAACSDKQCEYRDELPLHFVDEDMYIDPPTMVIGTVDKFAMLAWRPEARSLFGRDRDGQQATSPPGLILQDELHLISGPLGTMVGLYETTIERLCTDTRGNAAIRPKIVSSTATIRSYPEQVRRVFGRDGARLFPPPGLSADDSFFATVAVDRDGKVLPGRVYVGVHAPGLGSVQTAQVRVFSSLLQSASALPGDEAVKDPWWTLLTFYNSLRELGGGLTLFYSDVPDYLWAAIRQRAGLPPASIRRLRRVEELTGRLDDQDVVSVISKLETETTDTQGIPVDVCLASNIVEVGVDIDRLSLLTVVGQPKSTAQYIQVTGRIGRRWKERPGLVVTVYGPSKPRDRSHYERFRTYHQQLYAQVEPTSVTPFSPPALERALHGAMLAYIRQTAPRSLVEDGSPPDLSDPVLSGLVDEFEKLAVERIKRVAQGDANDLSGVLRKRRREWAAWQPLRWSGPVTPDKTDVPLMRWPGRYASRNTKRASWQTPTSMRNVDAECRVEITQHYMSLDATTDSEGEQNSDG